MNYMWYSRWVVQNYFRFYTRISRDLSSSSLCKWCHDTVSPQWYGKTDLLRLCVSFKGAYWDFVLFAEAHSVPAACSAYGPVRVLCSVKTVALQRAYSVAFIFLYTMQQLTNSLLAEYCTVPSHTPSTITSQCLTILIHIASLPQKSITIQLFYNNTCAVHLLWAR